jgi:hypothetical protein
MYIVLYRVGTMEHWRNEYELCDDFVTAEKCKEFHNNFHTGNEIHKDAIIGKIYNLEEKEEKNLH